jgi:transposase
MYYIVSSMTEISKDTLLLAPRQHLIDTIMSQQQQLQELDFQLQWFKRQVFGTKSERFVADEELQTALELGVKPPQPPVPQTQKVSYERHSQDPKNRTAGHGRGTMPTHLPVDEEIIQPQEDLTGLVRIGEEVSWYYDMQPGSLRIKMIVRPVYARESGHGVLTAPLPPLPIEKGNAGPGLMTQVTIDKYVYHLPLDRQRKKFKNEYDVDFSESWLCDIVRKTAFWITPVYELYTRRLLSATYLQADETPIPVLVKDKKGKTHRGYFWVYHDPGGKIVIFVYRQSRSAQGPSEFLRDFKGTLQVDGYDGYNQVVARPGITRAACMDHVRRRFEQALEYDPARATYALEAMKPWYEVESEAKREGRSLEERFARRVAQTVPAMRMFKKWLSAQISEVLPKSPIGQALSYALNQWPHFEPFMTDPRIEISNILVENAIRPIAIGRNNYLFCGSHDAARRAAMIYSLAATAKLHGQDPFVYLKDLLTRLPASTNQQIDSFLLPEWKLPPKISE